MGSETAIPFFVYNKYKKEAYLIVLNPLKTKLSGGVNNVSEQRIIQESKLSWSSRSAVGA